MLQVDKTGSQMMCMVRGRLCVTMAIILTLTTVINMVLLSVVINSEMVANWHSNHGNHIAQAPEIDHLAREDVKEVQGDTEKLYKVHHKYQDHHKKLENAVETSAYKDKFAGLKHFRGERIQSPPVEKHWFPGSPLPESSDIQVAVIASEVPPKAEKKARTEKPSLSPFFLAQAKRASDFAEVQKENKDQGGRWPLGDERYNRKFNRPQADDGYNSDSRRGGRQTRHVQSIEHQHHNEELQEASTVREAESSNRGGDRDKRQKREGSSIERMQKLKERGQAAFALHSLSVESNAEAMQRKTEERYPAFKSRKESKQRTQPISDEKKEKRLRRKENKRKKGKVIEEGETFSSQDIETFKKHLKRKERKQKASQDNNKKNEESDTTESDSLDTTKTSKNKKGEKRKGKGRKAEKVKVEKAQVLHEYNVEHKTDEDWEPHEDMSIDQLLLAEDQPKRKQKNKKW